MGDNDSEVVSNPSDVEQAWNSWFQEFSDRYGEEQKGDRGRAIIAAVDLDEVLNQLLRAFVVPGLSNKQTERLFDDFTGVFSTFSAKINVAHSMGLISEDEYRDLHLIRDIRNKFAHKGFGLSFGSPKISDQCESLRLPKQNTLPSTEPRDLFNFAVIALVTRFAQVRIPEAREDRRTIPPEIQQPGYQQTQEESGRRQVKIHVEIYIASRLLEREQGEFTAGDLIERVHREFGDDRLGVRTHATAHCVANAKLNAPTAYNYLWRIDHNRYRCFDPLHDSPHETRAGGRIQPEESDMPAEYRRLL